MGLDIPDLDDPIPTAGGDAVSIDGKGYAM